MASAIAPGPRPADAQAATVVPTQWIAKQFTELLGRAPTTAEWTSWTTYYQAQGCSTASLKAKSRELLVGSEFAGRYPETQKAGRLVAINRAVYNHDLNSGDWSLYYAAYADGSRTWAQTIDLYFGAIFDQLVRPSVCSTTNPGYGFGAGAPLDVKSLIGQGASRTQATLQTQLDAAAATCGTVSLAAYEVVRVGGPPSNQLLRVPPCVTLNTSGSPTATAYGRQGRLVAAGAVCDTYVCPDIPVVRLGAGAKLRNVWVDARNAVVGGKTVGVELAGSTTATPGAVTNVRVSDPGPGGTGIRLSGFATTGTECAGAQVADNLVTGYARSHALDRAARAQWADGISIFCEQATVERNAVVDVGDWGIGLFGVRHRTLGLKTQRSVIRTNTVLSAGVPGSVAVGVDPTGVCRSIGVTQGDPGGLAVPCLDNPQERSFAGARVENNTFWTGSRTSFDVGLMIGGKTYWGDHGAYGRGIAVTGNTTGAPGARVNVGIAVSGMYDTLLTGNTGAAGVPGAYTLVDTIGGTTADLPGCPQVTVGDTRPYLASFAAGSQASTTIGLYGCLLPPTPTGGLERVVTTTANGGSFVGGATGVPFTPLGSNYQPVGYYIDDDLSDPAHFRAIVADFVEQKQAGTNILRLHPQFNRFMLNPTTPNPVAYDRLARLVDVASDIGLYLDITGLGIWRPSDNRDDPDDPNDADEAWLQDPSETLRWQAQSVFWGEMARRLSGKPAVLFFNLMNEPVVSSTAWGCPNGTGIYNACFVQAITLDRAGRQPRDIARAWIGQLTTAIRAHDADVPITVGSLGHLGWPPSWIGDITDMMVSHDYMRGDDPATSTDEFAEDLAQAKSFKQPGKPLVIEEFFYNFHDPDPAPPNTTLCNQACMERFINESRPEVNGWIGHASGETLAQMEPLGDLYYYLWQQFLQRQVSFRAPCGSCQPS